MAKMSIAGLAQETATVGPAPAVRPSLRIGPVDDPLEREADRIADAVVSGRPVAAITGTATTVPQRKCAQCAAEEEKTLRRKSASPAPASNHDANAAAASLATGGTGLSPQQRAYFEPRFGRDLSGVRLHLGDAAGAAAAQVNARAFTLGNDIAFAQGEFNPETRAGRHLLAHELAHVVAAEIRLFPSYQAGHYWRRCNPQIFRQYNVDRSG